jgi:hypothetical protein
MTSSRRAIREQRIAQGKCPRCGRLVDSFPARRPDVCSPFHWRYCIRAWPNILAAEARLRAATNERPITKGPKLC